MPTERRARARSACRHHLDTEPVNLEEAEMEAADLERYSREERQANWSSSRLPSASNRLNNQSMQVFFSFFFFLFIRIFTINSR